MKVRHLIYLLIALLFAVATLRAGDSGTNGAPRSCCQPSLEAATPLADKSLYQLESTWANDRGQGIKLESLRGRSQIVVMFFTSCQSTCPLLVFQLQQIEAALPETIRTNVGFTLVSFDPKRDTSAALKDYRDAHKLAGGNWTLLRGDADAVMDLAAVLGVKYTQDTNGQFRHSNLITVLNAGGEIVYQQNGLGSDNQEILRCVGKLVAH